MTLPPFPTDPQTLAMLRAAIDPGPEAERTSLHDLLTLMSELGGSDTTATTDRPDDAPDIPMIEGDVQIVYMRDPHYHPNDVILALISEVERLREDA